MITEEHRPEIEKRLIDFEHCEGLHDDPRFKRQEMLNQMLAFDAFIEGTQDLTLNQLLNVSFNSFCLSLPKDTRDACKAGINSLALGLLLKADDDSGVIGIQDVALTPDDLPSVVGEEDIKYFMDRLTTSDGQFLEIGLGFIRGVLGKQGVETYWATLGCLAFAAINLIILES